MAVCEGTSLKPRHESKLTCFVGRN